MSFPKAFMEELRNRVSLSSIIGRRVKLVRKGREHSGLCPFHNEKSPSFTVSDDKGFYHCFGCGAHGDVIDFVERSENLSFPEAVERLAGEAGMQVPQATPEEVERDKKRHSLIEVMEHATAWFEKQLRSPQGKVGLDYFRGRGLNDETMVRFRLGYAPGGDALRQYMRARDIPEDVLIEAGLTIKPDDGRTPYDRFRERVMFPITDRQGRVMAFGARALGDAKPKYLNSPETPLFHKGHNLYGLSNARSAARDSNTLVVTEGYMDVIALAQMGLNYAVAPLGTAVTEDQINQLWRVTPEPILCLDGDAAGQRAAVRASERALPILRPGHSLKFAFLPQGEDPDTLVRSQGVEAFLKVLDEAKPLAELLVLGQAAGRELSTPEQKAAFKQDLIFAVNTIKDESVKAFYRDYVYDRLDKAFGRQQKSGYDKGGHGGGANRYDANRKNYGQKAGFAKAGGAGFGQKKEERLSRSVSFAKSPANQALRREQSLIALVLNYPILLREAFEEVAEVEFLNRDLDTLRNRIVEITAGVPDLDADDLKGHLSHQGFATLIETIMDADFIRVQGFTDASLTDDEVLRQWRDLYWGQNQKVTVQAEHRTANARLKQDMTDQALESLKAYNELKDMTPVASDEES